MTPLQDAIAQTREWMDCGPHVLDQHLILILAAAEEAEGLRAALQELMDVHALSLQGTARSIGGDKFALRHRKAWEAARSMVKP